MISTATRARGNTLIKIRELRGPSWNPGITMSCAVVCLTGTSRILSNKNVVIMICMSGRHRSVANAELWSNTLARYSRHQHPVSLLHLSELNFWKNRVQENVRNAANSLPKCPRHNNRVRAKCWRFASVPESVTSHWKRSRLEHYVESLAGSKSLATRADNSARPAKDSLDGEYHSLQASKKASDKCLTHTCWDEPES